MLGECGRPPGKCGEVPGECGQHLSSRASGLGNAESPHSNAERTSENAGESNSDAELPRTYGLGVPPRGIRPSRTSLRAGERRVRMKRHYPDFGDEGFIFDCMLCHTKTFTPESVLAELKKGDKIEISCFSCFQRNHLLACPQSGEASG